jgi:hypothetical protein
MAYFPTTGKLTIRLASDLSDYKLGKGITVKATPAKGIQTLAVASPAGWLHYEEIDGAHVLVMSDPPAETTVPVADESTMSVLRYISTQTDPALAKYATQALADIREREVSEIVAASVESDLSVLSEPLTAVSVK